MGTWDLHGVGGDAFLLGVKIGAIPGQTPPAFFPGYGIVELDPFAPSYIPILDGIGLFGTPNPFAVFPASGHYQLSLTFPPLPIAVSATQFIEVNPNSPNGLVYLSNTTLFP